MFAIAKLKRPPLYFQASSTDTDKPKYLNNLLTETFLS